MLIIGCPGSKDLARSISKKLKASYTDLIVEKFPDNELRVRIPKDVKGKTVVIVQSFHDDISDDLVEVLFAAYTSKEIGAKKLILVAPYIAYMREDKRFEKGESVSARIMAKILRIFDKVLVVDPHLHRFKSLNEFFPNASKLTAINNISSFIKNNIKDCIIVGPDEESEQWVKAIANKTHKRYIVLKKKRLGHRKVKVSQIKENIKGKTAVIVDDIISTGHTILEAAKSLKKGKARRICCVAVHGVFAENALGKLQKAGINTITTNTIPNKVAKIDISDVVSKELAKY